ncbi:hypothetical protein LCGC14_0920800 [marine sediment metagenome]|uniref:Uncharacterized protein n=1 Tax=marine sediment metagenome TaxID=412755 RepID=A0A0F9NVQ0_9ZZZZ
MTLIILEPPREGFGADRFLIRNGARARNELAIRLRPFIQELPERLIDPAQFPQPGRRGPSRPPPTFPGTREQRSETSSTIESENLLTGEVSVPAPSVECVAAIQGGTHLFNFSIGTPALEFQGQSGQAIPRPFIINSVGHISTVGRNASLVFVIEVADDDDTTTIAGSVFPREGILGEFTVGQNTFPTNTFQMYFPQHKISRAGRFIKMWLFNNTAGAAIVDVSVNFTLL